MLKIFYWKQSCSYDFFKEGFVTTQRLFAYVQWHFCYGQTLFFPLEVDILNTYFPNVNNKSIYQKAGWTEGRIWDFKEFNCSTGLLPTLALGCSVVGGVISGTQSVWARPRCFVTRCIVQTVALQSAVFTVIICITNVGNLKPEERGKIVSRWEVWQNWMSNTWPVKRHINLNHETQKPMKLLPKLWQSGLFHRSTCTCLHMHPLLMLYKNTLLRKSFNLHYSLTEWRPLYQYWIQNHLPLGGNMSCLEWPFVFVFFKIFFPCGTHTE